VVGHSPAEVAEAAEAADSLVAARTYCLLEVVPVAAGIHQLVLWEIASSSFHLYIVIVYERVGADTVAVAQESFAGGDRPLTTDAGSGVVFRSDSPLGPQAMREDVVQGPAQGHNLAE
jgi:hypothetical protein